MLRLYCGLLWLIPSLVVAATHESRAIDPDLVGTWTSKSGKVVTGDGFYNPDKDEFIEPDLPGISYTFTKDGHWEEALYRVSSNPSDPGCVSASLIFQHGEYEIASNGSLILTPIDDDGRQLKSDPCANRDHSTYTRYSQPKLFKQYEIINDAYYQKKRLHLFQFDGAPMNPLLLVSGPPKLLPTTTLNPMTSSTHKKRAVDVVPTTFRRPASRIVAKIADANLWWWTGISMTSVGVLIMMIMT